MIDEHMPLVDFIDGFPSFLFFLLVLTVCIQCTLVC